MDKETKKNESISCACGKADLYEEWLKNENKKKKVSDTKAANETEDTNSFAETADKED